MLDSKAITIVSGGLDSVTLAHLLHKEGHELHLLSFDYGQRHKKELEFARLCARRLEVAFDAMQRLAVEGFGEPNLRLEAPFLHLGKHEIVSLGVKLGVSFSDTWSCYKGSEKHCGRCGTCVERKHAFRDAGVIDPTHYEDLEYGFDLME